LERQHRDLLALLDELEFTGDSVERTRLIALAAVRLKAHAALKEDVFYPAVQGERAAVDEALAAQRAIDLLLDETVGTPSAANVKVLRGLVEQSFAGDEQHLFPVAQALDDAAGADLAKRLERYAHEVDDDAPLSEL
jgi:hypothetical protein